MMLEAETINLQCSSVTNTQHRQRYVDFSVTIFASGVKALVKKDSGIRSLRDINDKVVMTTSGTTSDVYVKSAAAQQGLFLNFRLGRDHDHSLPQVLNGNADAMLLDDVLLRGLLMNIAEADAYTLVVLEENFAIEPYGIMFRRNDPVFKALVDDKLIGRMKSGEFSRIHDKWFVAPIPPKGKSLRPPMNDVLKRLIVTPNDSGICISKCQLGPRCRNRPEVGCSNKPIRVNLLKLAVVADILPNPLVSFGMTPCSC